MKRNHFGRGKNEVKLEGEKAEKENLDIKMVLTLRALGKMQNPKRGKVSFKMRFESNLKTERAEKQMNSAANLGGITQLCKWITK